MSALTCGCTDELDRALIKSWAAARNNIRGFLSFRLLSLGCGGVFGGRVRGTQE